MHRILIAILTLAIAAPFAGAQDKPIKGLIVSGGCCHDYGNQKKLIADAVKAHVKAEFDVAGDNPAQVKEQLNVKGWADGYDVIVYNFCDAGQQDMDYIGSVIKLHKETGKAAVMIHCAMHSFHWKVEGGRNDFSKKSWVELVGVGSPNHGPKAAIAVTTEADAKDHPVMKDVPAEWKTKEGELYRTPFIGPKTKVLAKGNNGKETHAVAWTNEYGKAKVFGTTLGHHNSTMQDANWQKLVANGVKWATSK
jgi:hypothetical protein